MTKTAKLWSIPGTDYAIERFDIAGEIIFTVFSKRVIQKTKPERETITSFQALASFKTLLEAEEYVQSLL